VPYFRYNAMCVPMWSKIFYIRLILGVQQVTHGCGLKPDHVPEKKTQVGFELGMAKKTTGYVGAGAGPFFPSPEFVQI
jgi:hypothetical protein